MTNIVKFPGAHVGASSTIRDKDSNVISEMPRSAARRTSDRTRLDGIPRVRQTLTVGTESESASATALVPPRESMTESDVSMEGTIVCGLQTCQGFANRKTTFGTSYGAMGLMPDPREVIFGRLEALRFELAKLNPETKFDTVEGRFAMAIGIHKTSWSQIKSFDRDLPLTAACRLKEQWGVSLDWLYYGDQPTGTQIMAKIGRGPVLSVAPAKTAKMAKATKRKTG